MSKQCGLEKELNNAKRCKSAAMEVETKSVEESLNISLQVMQLAEKSCLNSFKENELEVSKMSLSANAEAFSSSISAVESQSVGLEDDHQHVLSSSSDHLNVAHILEDSESVPEPEQRLEE